MPSSVAMVTPVSLRHGWRGGWASRARFVEVPRFAPVAAAQAVARFAVFPGVVGFGHRGASARRGGFRLRPASAIPFAHVVAQPIGREGLAYSELRPLPASPSPQTLGVWLALKGNRAAHVCAHGEFRIAPPRSARVPRCVR